ncbi:MAG: hypothetical protein HQK96_09405 [Nitrospirae bacterium]|nr:hypothetical protein [Nitrospirota bacterium]
MINVSKAHRITSRQIYKKGKMHGRDWRWSFWPPKWPFRKEKIAVPSVDSIELSDYENTLLQNGSRNVSSIAEEWSEKDKKLYQSCMDAVSEYKSAKDSVATAKGVNLESSGTYKVAGDVYRELERPSISKTFYVILSVVMFISEASFNTMIFKFMGMKQTETMVIASGLTLVLFLIAHFSGHITKKDRKILTDKIILIGSAIALIAGLYVLAEFRMIFFEALQISKEMGVKWSDNSIMISFFIINMLFTSGVFIFSYMAAYKDPERFSSLKDNYLKAKKHRNYGSKDLSSGDKRLLNSIKVLNKVHSDRTRSFAKYQKMAETERKAWVVAIHQYREANTEARNANEKYQTRPACFDINVDEKIRVPSELTELNDCGNCYYNVYTNKHEEN